MATLLGIICTDVAIAPGSMHKILQSSTNSSFNSISIDGDTSTNDTVALFANGAAAPSGVEPLALPATNQTTDRSADLQAFQKVLTSLMIDLAKLVVRDGEGATKFVTIRVHSDVSRFAAKRVAESIATSSLVKTALYGKDANWGRILCAIGYAPGVMQKQHVEMDLKTMPFTVPRTGVKSARAVKPQHTSVSFVPSDGSEELKLLVRGEPEQVDEDRAKQILEMEDLEILVRLNDYDAAKDPATQTKNYHAVFWTCDFSHEYVTINGDYRT